MRLRLLDADTLTRRTLTRKLRGLGHEVVSAEPRPGEAFDDGWLVVAHGVRGVAYARLAERRSVHDGGPPWLALLHDHPTEAMRRAALLAGADDVLETTLDEGGWHAHLAVAERAAARERAHAQRARSHASALVDSRSGLEAAAAMQHALLPRSTHPCPGVRTAWTFVPCDRVAGDLLSAHALDDTRTAFFLLDVAGHGVAAAMFAFSLSLSLRPVQPGVVPFHAGALAAPTDLLGSPAELLLELNRRHQDDGDLPRHFALAYGVVDTRRATVRIAQAGTPAPLAQRGRTLLERALPGPPLGLLPNALYDELEIDVDPGDRLYLYSDGISECPDPQARPFGGERLIEVLRREAHADLDVTVRAVECALRQWRGESRFPDDVSLLALELA